MRADDSAVEFDPRPPLAADVSFWGMTATQFLGAFNDNLFKQLVLLICVDYAARLEGPGDVYQTMAQALFALPFVLFSGLAGWLSDRTSKRTIVVLSKVAEIVVMLGGVAAFLSGGMYTFALLYALFAVLFLMGAQSAFFGPAKYGILPEMFREGDLPAANGIVQMTTFLAIIFGTVAAGHSKHALEAELWNVSWLCVGIAVIGTVTSLFVRRTRIAHPGLPFSAESLGVNRETVALLRADRPLLVAVLITSLFWFIGGVVLPAVNAFGKLQLGLPDDRTSVLAACMGVGIALGCLLAGQLSKHRVNFAFVRVGAWGIFASMTATSLLGVSGLPVSQIERGAWISLTSLGVFAGFFAVPLQVFLQSRPPADQKGRMIGTMNLANWIGILLSAGFYFACTAVLKLFELPVSWAFFVTGLMMLPVAILYFPAEGTSATTVPRETHTREPVSSSTGR